MPCFGLLPVSLAFFAISAAVVAVMAIPLIGIFLMLLMGAYWSIFLINAGFLGIGVEALLGLVNRLWLIAPIAWYGWYGYMAWQSHRDIDALVAQAKAFNAGKQIAFDPAHQSLVVVRSQDASGMLASLTQNYDLPVAYEPNPNFKSAAHLSVRLGAGELCDRIGNGLGYSAASIHAFGIHEGPDLWRRQLVRGICSISAPADPEFPAVSVALAAPKEQRQGALVFETQVATLKDARNGAEVDLLSISASPLKWFPMPVVGCGIDFNRGQSPCFSYFAREFPSAPGGSPTELVAAALGLTRAPASARSDKIAAQPFPAAFDAAVTNHLQSELAELDKAIKDVRKEKNTHFQTMGLEAHPETYAARTSEIVEALRVRLATPNNHRGEISSLGDLLGALPETQFLAVAQSIAAMLANAPGVSSEHLSRGLNIRMASVDVFPLSLAERIVSQIKPGPESSPYYYYCLVGERAAHHADEIAAHLRATGRKDYGHMVSYIALLRIGRGDLLAEEQDKGSPFRSKDYAYWAQTITPKSPPEVCSPR